jgi:hypothetical protein
MSNPVEARVAAAIDKLSYIPKYAKDMLVRSASGEGADTSGLPITAFADGSGREYPCHCKEAVYASAVKYTLAGDGRKGVLDEIAKAARVFEIEDDMLFAVDGVRQNVSAVKSAGYGAAVYALPAEGYFPIGVPEYLADSMADLRKSANLLPYRMRFIAATNMLKAAEFHGVDATAYVKAAAGLVTNTPGAIGAGLMDRVPADHRSRHVYKSAAESLRTTARIGRENALKLTAALDIMDKVAGLHDDYSSIPTPEEIVFLPEKRARAGVRLSNGFSVDMGRVKASSLVMDDLVVFGSDFCDAVGEDPIKVMALPKEAGVTGDPHINYGRLADMLPTLGPGDANTFMSLLRERTHDFA